MPTGVTFEIKGLKELEKTLLEQPPKVFRKIVRDALKQGAELIRKAIVDKANQSPVGRSDRPRGFLKEHFDIKVKLSKDGLAGEAFIGPKGRTYYPNLGSFHANKKGRMVPDSISTGKFHKAGGVLPVASVARFLEFGTSKAPPHPFMGPAFNSTAPAALNMMIDKLRSALEKIRKG